MTDFPAQVSIEIQAPIEKVWDALTKPELVKQYFFGVDLITDWQVGNDIVYKGEWEGKAFEDKGTVLEVDKPHRLVSNYWSPSSGVPDTLENRQVITYELGETATGTKVSINQAGNKTEDAQTHAIHNWQMVLDGMKKLLEA